MSSRVAKHLIGLGAVVTAGMLLAGCSSSKKDATPAASDATTTTSIVAAPAGLPPFYAVPEPLPTKPGTLIKAEKVDAPDVHGDMYRVMYTSTGGLGQPTAVTGLVAVPKGAPPADGFKVMSWSHGTDGMADICAPSTRPGDPNNDAMANLALDQGWVYAATDYQGEGTPGLHPYIAGDVAAHNAIDIVRAARNMPQAHTGTDYVAWGHSQGGHTAMFVDKLAPAYAPELRLHGVVAGAPPSQFDLIYAFLRSGSSKHLLLMAAGGLNAAYGDKRAPLDEVLKPKGIAMLPVLDQGCQDVVAKRLANVDIDTIAKGDPFKNPTWGKLLAADDPERFATPSPVPLLIVHGGNDELIPTASSEILAKHLCGIGQNLDRWVYPGYGHADVIAPSARDTLAWMRDRFADKPVTPPYAPTGVKNVAVTHCAK